MTTDSLGTEADLGPVHYDPFDFAIDDDPYPVWKRLRDEAPLYHNAQYDLYALSRYHDVAAALGNWTTYRSGRGTVPEVLFARQPIPPGIILWEDPPIHDLHRRLLTRVFTPRRMLAVEPLVRDFCAAVLDPLVGEREFDVVAGLGALMPMRTIGYLLGIPEEMQPAIRAHTDGRMELASAELQVYEEGELDRTGDLLTDYVDWRAEHPGDDLTTELLNAELEDGGVRRKLTRDEVKTYVGTIAGAGNETTTRLIGFMTQLLAQHPDQRSDVAADPTLIPQVVEETLRFEAPSPAQGRYVARDVDLHGTTLAEGSVVLLLNGSANRDERVFDDPDTYDIHRPRTHLSFGTGLHFCLGASLARLEGRVALEELLKRWPEWDVDLDRATRSHTSSVRGWASLPVVVP